MENGLKVMLFFGAAAIVFYLFSKILEICNLSKTKFESIGAGVLLCLIVAAFLLIFGFENPGASEPWERLQRK